MHGKRGGRAPIDGILRNLSAGRGALSLNMEAIAGSYITAFLLGLFSAAHCAVMCGPIVGTLTLSQHARGSSQSGAFFYVLNYNLGRLLSYSLAGAVVGFLGAPFVIFNSHSALQYLSAIVLALAGFYLAGWLPAMAYVEKIGVPIWRWLQPIGQKLLPVRTLRQALCLGMVWGFLPCGLVYAALAVAATIGDPLKAGLTMLAFGLGTLPAMLSAGLLTGFLSAIARSKKWRVIAGIAIILMAALTLLPIHHGQAMPPMAHH